MTTQATRLRRRLIKWWKGTSLLSAYRVATNMSLYHPYSKNITAIFVTYLYENQCSLDVDTDIARNVWMRRLKGMNTMKICVTVSWDTVSGRKIGEIVKISL